jgi:uncharacterized protein YdiU (UPF0061 family)
LVPDDIGPLKKSFYDEPEGMDERWSEWLEKWKFLIFSANTTDANSAQSPSREDLSRRMKLVNPKYSLREWFVVPAYNQATEGNYSLVRELQEVMTQPYAEHSKEVEEKYYRRKPSEFFEIAGLSHVSCSS